MRRYNTYSICLIFALSISLIIIGTQYVDNTLYFKSSEHWKSIKVIIKVEDGKDTYVQEIPIKLFHSVSEAATNKEDIYTITNTNQSHGSALINNASILTHKETHLATDIENILDKARSDIRQQLSNFNLSCSGAHSLEDLVMESGGHPIRTLVISSWRSGSTFLGDLVNSIPSNYYHYEPLLMYGTKQLRRPTDATEALSIVRRMFKCNFEGLEEYFEFESKDLSLFSHSTRLWEYCKNEKSNDLCFNGDFISRICKLFPFQSMKLVRLRLSLVDEILNDNELNVRVILLMRDPRGLMQSRRHRRFCELSSDCWEPSLVCADMISDYVAARNIMQRYPGRLLVVRFEDLALKPDITTQKILDFMRVDGRKAFDEFLESHTNMEVAGVHSTFKVTRNIPFKWKYTLDYNYVNDLQIACKEAMRLWGYKMVYNETHMMSNEFNPVEDYTISK
ncbi:hypothetical protein HF086_006579 [Spodoptera exigua]|uniref:Sulfotransferase domain-containing protein n=1 Tax=Spodoptera exigua TaxID=7107 RepID=A0A922M992_SPOEX|nr:hypothetical protein HF086_006579 [Spodoptera exigua]